MKELNSKIREYYALPRRNFRDLSKVEIIQKTSMEGYGTILNIEVLPIDADDIQRLQLSFEGVINLRLTPPERMVLQIITLEITNIGDQQWDGLFYKVRETEHDTLSFLCYDFNATITTTGY